MVLDHLYGKKRNGYLSIAKGSLAGVFRALRHQPVLHKVVGRVTRQVFDESMAASEGTKRTKDARVKQFIADGVIVLSTMGDKEFVDLPHFASDVATVKVLVAQKRERDRLKTAAKRARQSQAKCRSTTCTPRRMPLSPTSEAPQPMSPYNLNTEPSAQQDLEPQAPVESVGASRADKGGEAAALAAAKFLAMVPKSLLAPTPELAAKPVEADSVPCGALAPEPKPEPAPPAPKPVTAIVGPRVVTPDYPGEPVCEGQVLDFNAAYKLRLDPKVVMDKGIGWNHLFAAIEYSSGKRARGGVNAERLVMHGAVMRKRGLWGIVSRGSPDSTRDGTQSPRPTSTQAAARDPRSPHNTPPLRRTGFAPSVSSRGGAG